VVIVWTDNPYDERYASRDFYWGKQPSQMCDRVIEIVQPSLNYRPKLLDLGCGEGRNAVYFAQSGFDVIGVDLSLPGLEKMQMYAREVGVQVEAVQADIADFQLQDSYDVIFSTGTLHYLPVAARTGLFQYYKEHTAQNGINALNVFVHKPFIPKAPDADGAANPFQSGELLGYYWDWEILYSTEEIFDCMSSGIPHRHAVNRIIARPPFSA
jgi:tellurite methyltransferase